MEKTNVHRLLDASHISYFAHFYNAEVTDGEEVARLVDADPNRVFKTLVTEDPNHHYYVFCIPVNAHLDLKKAAKAAHAKSISMILQKNLLPLTGYIHGGCSPIGMKKAFPTFIEETAQLFDTIMVSAGKRGCQVELSPIDLAQYASATFVDLI